VALADRTRGGRIEDRQRALRAALSLSAALFGIGAFLGVWAQSTGILAHALQMLSAAVAYALALVPGSQRPELRRLVSVWAGWLVVLMGVGILADIGRSYLQGSQPVGLVMLVYGAAALTINLIVLVRLAPFSNAARPLRARFLLTRGDVLAPIALSISGYGVADTGWRLPDLLVGLAIGLLVLKEAVEVVTYEPVEAEADKAAP
jgi:Co/Zn/Cd efflux system component